MIHRNTTNALKGLSKESIIGLINTKENLKMSLNTTK
jgi:hypothetical protein